MKTLKQINGKVKWMRPKADHAHNEVSTQLQMLAKNPKAEHLPDDVRQELEHLKNKQMYERALENAKVKKIKPDKTHKIDNHTFEEGSWNDLDPKKKEHIVDDFKRGESHMPIILRNKNTRKKWLLSGNTRLTYQSQVRKKKTPCLIISYND